MSGSNKDRVIFNPDEMGFKNMLQHCMRGHLSSVAGKPKCST